MKINEQFSKRVFEKIPIRNFILKLHEIGFKRCHITCRDSNWLIRSIRQALNTFKIYDQYLYLISRYIVIWYFKSTSRVSDDILTNLMEIVRLSLVLSSWFNCYFWFNNVLNAILPEIPKTTYQNRIFSRLLYSLYEKFKKIKCVEVNFRVITILVWRILPMIFGL